MSGWCAGVGRRGVWVLAVLRVATIGSVGRWIWSGVVVLGGVSGEFGLKGKDLVMVFRAGSGVVGVGLSGQFGEPVPEPTMVRIGLSP
ncbi:hypothetical protein V6N13_076733 [Hibiscus sabdariffa]|uniref:Uncharacterized protein n=1 Tax=Hibiscus sabdariffa TaxID=183260 RepID=A0ABR2B1N8_9ROSI